MKLLLLSSLSSAVLSHFAKLHHHQHFHPNPHQGCHAGGCRQGSNLSWLHAQPILLAQLPPPPPVVSIPVPFHKAKMHGFPSHGHRFQAQHLQTEKQVTKLGLIQVQLPAQTPVLTPAAVTQNSEYSVERPKLGKVVDQSQPSYFCKRPGFVLEGQMCVQTIVEEPRSTCPGGFEARGSKCIRRVSSISTCASGHIRKNDQCVKIASAPYSTRCPPDYEPIADGAWCEREIKHPLTPSCPDGIYDALTGNCIVQHFVQPQAYCPEGFNFTGGSCIQEEVYDCTEHASPRERLLESRKDCDPTPCTASPAICAVRDDPCDGVAPTSVLQPTRTTITVQKTCTRVTSTALIFACTQGILHANQCCVKQAVPPVPICTAEGDASHCFTRERVAPVKECPFDYDEDCEPGEMCRCISYEYTAQALNCPTGFELDREGCQRVAASQPECPPGFSFQDDVCVRILREPADCVFSVTYECDKSKGPCVKPSPH